MSVNNASPNTNNNNAPILPKRSQSRVVLGNGRSPSNSFSNGFVRAAPGGKKTGIILTGHMRTALVMKEEAPAELEKPTLVPNLSLAANATTENNVRQAVYLKLTTNRRMSDVLHDRLSTKSRELPNLETKQISRSFEDVPMPVHSSSPRKSRDQLHATTAPPELSADTFALTPRDAESHQTRRDEFDEESRQVLLSEEEFLEYIRTRQLEFGEFELEVDHVIIDESDDEDDTEDLLTPIAELHSPLSPDSASPVTPVTLPLASDVSASSDSESLQQLSTQGALESSTAASTELAAPRTVVSSAPVPVAPPPNPTITEHAALQPHAPTKLLPWSLNSVRSQLDVLTDIDEQQKAVLWHLFSQVHVLVEQFAQASEEWRMQSVNDALNPPVGIQVRAQLCTALASAFGNNFNSWRLFGQYHFWDYITAVTSSRDLAQTAEVTALIQTVNQLKALADPNFKFRQLMCAGLNAKQLDKWLDVLFNNKDQTTRFYYDAALVRRHPKLITLALQPLSKLPFVLDPDFDSRFH